MTQQTQTKPQSKPTVRINCGVDFKPQQGIGGYSAMVTVGDEAPDVIAGVVDERPTFIRCCLMAAVEGFEAVNAEGQSVEVVTPSTWIAETVSDTAKFQTLRGEGWVDADGKEVVHQDLLARLAECIDRQENVTWRLAEDVGRRKPVDTEESPAVTGPNGADAVELQPDCRISYAASTVGNSGVGAYCIELQIPGRVERVSSKFQTTNFARMQLMACIDAMKEARRLLRKDGLRIVLETPDEFTANAVNRGWLEEWYENRWKRREGDRVRNADLWQEFRRHIQRHDFEIRLTMDSANSDKMLHEAQTLARREIDRGKEDTEFQKEEEAAVAAGTLIRIFTDGSARENPGPGGWGAIMEVKGKKARQSKGYRRTTNNRMELMGAAESLDFLVDLAKQKKISTDTRVIVITDSEYLVSAMTRGWAKRWRKNQWVKQDGEKAKNTDLWKRILHAGDRLKKVDYRWVRGHARYRQAFGAENNQCDQLAKKAAAQPEETLAIDDGYED